MADLENNEEADCNKSIESAGDPEARARREREWEEAKAQGLSKNQWRKQRRRQEQLATRQEKRIQERERRKKNRQVAKAAGTFVPAGRKYLMKDSDSKVKVVIDLSFADYMNDADCKNALCQVGHCYGANRRTPNPLQLYACGVDDKIKSAAKQINAFENWDIHMHEDSIDKVFSPSEIVYLCAESDNVLTTLDESKAYIIGGLVDHNHHKGLCFRMTQEKGYGHARLPIQEYMQLPTRKVLTINHVFEIILKFSISSDWKKALFEVIPERKRKNPNEKEDSSLETSDSDNVYTKNTETDEPLQKNGKDDHKNESTDIVTVHDIAVDRILPG